MLCDFVRTEFCMYDLWLQNVILTAVQASVCVTIAPLLQLHNHQTRRPLVSTGPNNKIVGILHNGHKRLNMLDRTEEIKAQDKANHYKSEAHLSNIYKFSLYLTGNRLRLRYRAQPVNAL
jgi:hypothetical protein